MSKHTVIHRQQLFEIHDQAWCPDAVRDGATDCLRFFAIVGRQFQGAVEPIEEVLVETGDRYVIDLCAGSGGPWLGLYNQVARVDTPPIVVMTDLFPNQPAMERAVQASGGRIQRVIKSVDATSVPADLPGLRTLFTAFHHFNPMTARAILQDAVDAGQGIAIFEQTRRSIWAMIFMLTLAPLALLSVPLMRPFRWSRLFWTYLIPAIPLVLLFDGIVSCLRTYSREELRTMTESLIGQPYQWRYGRARTLLSPLGISYLIGYPSTVEVKSDASVIDSVPPRVARTK